MNLKDKLVQASIESETARQKSHIELIASENFVSDDILQVTGSILTNKYAEGYPGKRYYDGCEFIDEIETLAIERTKKLFGAAYANVQPHSGSQANAAAMAALINPGDKVMGMSLDSGGHLTHGYKITFSGTFYRSVAYEVDANGLLDYDAILKLAMAEKPQLIICGYSAYSRTIDFKKFREIADKVGAKLMADIAHIAGIVAVGLHPSPFPYADVVTSTTHKTLRGARGGIIMTNHPDVAKKVDRWVFPGFQGGPLNHVIAGKAITMFEALDPSFKVYIAQLLANAEAFANEFMKLGVPVISGGTDNHLFTINVKKAYHLSGKEAAAILTASHITVNKNTIPRDELGPQVASGIRLGTPAMTTRGFKVHHFVQLAHIIDRALRTKANVAKEVAALVAAGTVR